MDQPDISKLSTWEGYKEAMLTVIFEALALLRSEIDLPQNTDENVLNDKMWGYFKKINRRMRLCFLLPTYEGQNPPHPVDKPKAKRRKKRPDFYWQFSDPLAVDEDYSDKRFVLECKCLGEPLRSDWVYNENYVYRGIWRFIAPEYEYGKGDNEGAMLGYVRSMDFDTVLTEINGHVASIQVSTLAAPLEGWKDSEVNHTEQVLQRPFPGTLYTLHHYWVDIRHCFRTTTENLSTTRSKLIKKRVRRKA